MVLHISGKGSTYPNSCIKSLMITGTKLISSFKYIEIYLISDINTDLPSRKSVETASHTSPCLKMDLMDGQVNITNENIETSSNIAEKANLISGNKPWTSSADDLEPSIAIRVSDYESVTITDVKLIKPVNIAVFNVTILDSNATTVYEMVGRTYLHKDEGSIIP